ncbi:TPA: hypothetical protein PC598_003293 [Morganella morganii]|nr:hypothetical protein [Morganella morganii]
MTSVDLPSLTQHSLSKPSRWKNDTMEITPSAFKPVSDFTESERREQMSPVARLIDFILSLTGLRPASSQHSESLAKKLAEPLYLQPA